METEMRRFLTGLLLLAALTLAAPNAWAICIKEVETTDKEKIQEIVDNAYFAGFVEGVYYQEYPNGTFKEAGVKPFMFYRADPGLDLTRTIVIKGSNANNPEFYDSEDWCERAIPRKGEYAELVLVRENGETKLLYNSLFGLGDYLKKHRENVKYVRPEDK